MTHEERLKRYFEQESVKGDLSAQQWEDVLRPREVAGSETRNLEVRGAPYASPSSPCLSRHLCPPGRGWGDVPVGDCTLGGAAS